MDAQKKERKFGEIDKIAFLKGTVSTIFNITVEPKNVYVMLEV